MTAWAIAQNTVGEAMRKKIIQVFVFVAIILIILSQAFAFFASPDAGGITQSVETGVVQGSRVELVIIKSMAFGTLLLTGLVMSIFLGLDLIPTEIERKTIYTILSKPVRRSSYLLGKQLGMSLTLLVNLGLMGLVFVGIVMYELMRVTGDLIFPWEILVGVFIIIIEFVMLGSVALFFSTFLTRNINAALTFFVFVIGILAQFWQSVARLAENAGNQFISTFMNLLHYIIPNLHNFNIHNPLIHPERLEEVNILQYTFLKALPYSIAYSAILLLLAIIIFDRKEM